MASTSATPPDTGGAAQSSVNPRYNNNHRALLFGTRLGHAPKRHELGRTKVSKPMSSPVDTVTSASSTMMEESNEKLVDELQSKVSQLREVGHGVRQEVTASLNLLDTMNSNFGRAQNLMSDTNMSLQKMMNQPGAKQMSTTVIFTVLLFLAFWFYNTSHHAVSSVTEEIGETFLKPSGNPADKLF